MIAEKMRKLGMEVIYPVLRIQYQPVEKDLEECKRLGKDIAVKLKKKYTKPESEPKRGDAPIMQEVKMGEVSIAMKELKERGWINEREDKKPGKGRPYKIYSLKIGLNEIAGKD